MSPRTAPHHSQPRPNRRYRRLLPTAVAVAALAAGGTSFGAPAAHAASAPPPHARHVRPAKRTAVVPRVELRSGDGAQHVTST
jgi:hypothetical protein